jgi:hypothetical protein
LYLVEKTNVEAAPGSGRSWGAWTSWALPPGEVPQMRGEPLRTKTNPSVSDLLVKRLKEVEEQKKDIQTYMFGSVGDFALVLADWDGKAHLDDLRAITKILTDRFNGARWESYAIIGALTELLDKRISWGDPDAASEYSSMVVGWDPNGVQGGGLGFLDVISHHPDDPTLAATAEKLFSDPKLGWINSSGNAFSSRVPIGTIRSALIGVPGFREAVVRALGNTGKAGTVTLGADGGFTNPWSGRGEGDKDNPDAPRAGTAVDFRVCDIYAHEISFLPGAPKCALYGPLAKRDQQIEACIEYLQRYSNDFKYDPDHPPGTLPGADSAPIYFPKLDHPATPDDVSEGRAIFSLSGSPRLVKISLPVSATWTGRPDRPGGTVWQAEELLVDGKWQAFFGFTGGDSFVSGKSPIAKVPASEIEFGRYRWQLAPGFEGRLAGQISLFSVEGSAFPCRPKSAQARLFRSPSPSTIPQGSTKRCHPRISR